MTTPAAENESARIDALRAALEAHGIDPSGTLGSGLSAVRAAEEGLPGSFAAGLALAERLAADGIDPERVLSDGLRAALGLAGRAKGKGPEARIAQALAPVEALARALHAADLAVWDTMSFAVPSVADVCDADLAVFGAHLERFGDMLVRLKGTGTDTSRIVAYGVGALCQESQGRPWILDPAYDLAVRVGETGGEPGWIWQIALTSWASALTRDGGQGTQAGLEPAAWATVIADLTEFLVLAPGAGMSAGSRLADGLASLSHYGGELLPRYPRWLGLMRGLIQAMGSNDLSPYLAVGNGIAGVAGHLDPDELTEVLALAVRLADRGLDPGGVLFEAFLPAAQTIGTSRALEVSDRMARQGFEPFFLLRDAVGSLGAAGVLDAGGDDGLENALELIVETAEAVHALGSDARKYLSDAVPYQASRSAGDAEAFRNALELGADLAGRGIDPGMTLSYGWAVAQEHAGDAPWVLDEARKIADALAAEGVDPNLSLRSLVPELLSLAGSDQAEFARTAELFVDVLLPLERGGKDASRILLRGASALADAGSTDAAESGAEATAAFRSRLSRVQSVLEALAAAGLPAGPLLDEALPAAAQASGEAPWRIDAVLDRCAEEAARGRDAATPLAQVTGCLAAVDGDDPDRFAALLAASLRFAARIAAPDRARMFQPAVESAAAASDGDPAAFEASLEALEGAVLSDLDRAPERVAEAVLSALPLLGEVAQAPEAAGARSAGAAALGALALSARRSAAALHGKDRDPSDLLWYGLRALRLWNTGQPERCARDLSLLGDVLAAETPEVGRLLVRSAQRSAWSSSWQGALIAFARVAAECGEGDAESAFPDVLPSLAAGARLFQGTDFDHSDAFRSLVRAAAAVAGRSTGAFARELGGLIEWLERTDDVGVRNGLACAVGRCAPLLARVEGAWSDLIRPTIDAHGVHAQGVLSLLAGIGEHWVQCASDLELLKEIVTQSGVRTLEVLESLIFAGLRSRAIADLSEERETLVAFLRDVPLANPRVYLEYRRIRQDAGLSSAERRRRIDGLSTELERLAAAVRAGEVPDEDVENELFPLVLTHVFPPATSQGPADYMRLYRQFPDRPSDVEVLGLGELQRRTYTLAQGAWELRAGAELDRGPWELAAGLDVRATEPSDAAALGWDLLGRWAEGRIGRGDVQRDLLARVLRQVSDQGVAAPAHAETPTELIAWKEILGDHARDATEEALLAARAADPERYDRMVQEKLTPPARVGAGLVKEVRGLARALGAGMLDADTVAERLARLLAAFEFDADALVPAIAACADRDEVRAELSALPLRPVEIEPGKEQSRLFADFLGQELATMQRELFGGPGKAAKLVHRRSTDAPPLEVTLEPTKRRAHAPVGFAEGVCVAVDDKLWNRPEFLQVVFWGPGGIAFGGMHVLLVQEGGASFLALPGINPSLGLLGTVQAKAALDFAVDYAWRLARALDCRGVWVPESPSIHSNRRAIHVEIARRAWPKRSTARHAFSYAPYAYSFQSAFEVPAPD